MVTVFRFLTPLFWTASFLMIVGCATGQQSYDMTEARERKGMMYAAHPRSQSDNRGQALLLAAARGDAGSVDALLSQGVGTNSRNPNGATSLQLAAAGGHLDVVQTLLANGADVNASDNNGTTPLMAATNGGYDPVMRALKAAGARGASSDDRRPAAPAAAAPDGGQWWQK